MNKACDRRPPEQLKGVIGASSDSSLGTGIRLRGVIFLLLAGCAVLSASSPSAGLGVEIGNWQPHSLNDEPRFTDFGSAGATPYYGLHLLFPVTKDFSLRLSAGYWALRNLHRREGVHALTLHALHLDGRFILVPVSPLVVYTMYGIGRFWGVENETDPFGKSLKSGVPGWSANLAAGIDLMVCRHLGFGLLFQYHIVRFKRPIGGVSDFSGPKVGLTSTWYF